MLVRATMGCLLVVFGMTMMGCNEPRYMGRTVGSWATDLSASDAYKRRAACEALASMGPQAAKAVPDLVSTLDDSNEGVQGFASVALASIGMPAVPALEALLSRTEPHLRFHAATALVKIDGNHAAGQAALMNVLTGLGNAEMAKRAQQVVVRVGEPFVPRLLKTVKEPYLPVRMMAVETLGKMRERAGSAVPALIEVIQGDDDWRLRRAAMESAANIGNRDQLESVYRGLLDDEQEELADTAGSLLKHIGVRQAVTGMEGHVEPSDQEVTEQ